MIQNLKNSILITMYKIGLNDKRNPQVVSIESTLQEIMQNKYSVVRFGDGELRWMYGFKQNSFQKNNKLMSKKLKKILRSDEDNVIVCIPEAFGKMEHFEEQDAWFWKKHMGKFRWLWCMNFIKGKKYYNANITRPYMEYREKENCKKIFGLWKKIFEKRNIVIVEGMWTRLGVNNDLFSNAAGIKRIECPQENAFEKYDEIKTAVIKNLENTEEKENTLVLIALGPTATILAYEIALYGYQAIDIGHIDIEYEWYLSGAKSKQKVEGKYVHEAGGITQLEVGKIESLYREQIVEQIRDC